MKENQKQHQVFIEGAGLSFTISENDSILGGILRSGVGIPYECNAGGCGSCKYTLIEGDVVDDFEGSAGLRASDKRKNKHLACVSRPQSDCVIEIKPDAEYVAKTRPKRVNATLQSVEKLTHDLWEFYFESDRPARFLPGQYAKLSLPGVAGPRSYSMCNNGNNDGRWGFQIKRTEGGSASSFLFDNAVLGSRITIDAPYSIAHLNEQSERPLICIAGGSGLAPMVSILHGAAKMALEGKRPILYYGARTVDDVISKEYLDRIPHFDVEKQYIPIVSEVEPGNSWSGPTGMVHEYLAESLDDDCQDCDYFIAGPPPMVDAVRRHLILERKIPVEHLHYDRFY